VPATIVTASDSCIMRRESTFRKPCSSRSAATGAIPVQ
jgi:hypothetical protein